MKEEELSSHEIDSFRFKLRATFVGELEVDRDPAGQLESS